MSEVLSPKSFPAWVKKLDKSGKPLPHTLLALDPGETTGVAIFIEGRLLKAFQIKTHNTHMGMLELTKLLDEYKPDMVAYEDYRIYDFKAAEHSWGTLHTPRLIGVLQCLLYQRGIKSFHQLAQQPKLFCTDTKLKIWNYYQRGERHARDAIRHGCYYLLFKNGQYQDAGTLDITSM